MVLVKDIYDAIDNIAPFALQSSGDNSGLLLGDRNAAVNKICIALDATNDVVNEAIANKADLLINHHPLIFHAVKNIPADSPIVKLTRAGMSLIAAHTNYDIAFLTNQMLEKLGFPESGVVLEKVHADGRGYGKVVTLSEAVLPEELAERVKAAFGCAVLRYHNAKRPIKTVAVCSGAAGGNVPLAIELGCDAYITGDVAWDRIVDAANHGLSLYDAGHFHTENIMCGNLKNQLSPLFPDIEIFVAKSSVDLCEYL